METIEHFKEKLCQQSTSELRNMLQMPDTYPKNAVAAARLLLAERQPGAAEMEQESAQWKAGNAYPGMIPPKKKAGLTPILEPARWMKKKWSPIEAIAPNTTNLVGMVAITYILFLAIWLWEIVPAVRANPWWYFRDLSTLIGHFFPLLWLAPGLILFVKKRSWGWILITAYTGVLALEALLLLTEYHLLRPARMDEQEIFVGPPLSVLLIKWLLCMGMAALLLSHKMRVVFAIKPLHIAHACALALGCLVLLGWLF